MRHFVDGWEVDGDGRDVTSATSVAGHRPALEDSSFVLPGRRGQVPVPGPPGTQQYVLAVECGGETYADARALVTELHRRIPEGRAVQLRRLSGSVDVSAPAVVFAATEVDSSALGRVSLTVKLVFTLPGGVWLDSDETTVTVPSGSSTLAGLVGGSAPMAPVWTITGNGPTTMIEITDAETGAWWRIAGNIPPGSPTVIDPLAHTAVSAQGSGPVDVAHMLTTGPKPFYLSPGAVVEQARNGPQATTVTARKAFYE